MAVKDSIIILRMRENEKQIELNRISIVCKVINVGKKSNKIILNK